jgi:hypothetical protein
MPGRTKRARRIERSVADQEDVRPGALGEAAVLIDQHRPGARVEIEHLVVGDPEVEQIDRFRLRAERPGGSAADGRSHRADAVAIIGRPLGEGERQGFDHDGGFAVAALRDRRPGAHPLRDPDVLADDLDIAPRDFERDLLELIHRQRRLDPDVGQRAPEPLQVLAQLEDRAVEGALGVVDPDAAHPGEIPEGDPNLGFRQKLPVVICDSLASRHDCSCLND